MRRSDRIREQMRELLAEYDSLEKDLAELEEDHFRVVIFGSARIEPDEPIYKMVMRLASLLGRLGIDIVTGGGPGLMDAANAGVKQAHEKGIRSIGLPILLPNRIEPSNRHLDIKREHSRFSTRLDEFMLISDAVIVAPGGIGTVLELMYVWQLMQVGLIPRRCVILLGTEFWRGLIEWMGYQQLRRGLINPDDLDFVNVADTEAEVLNLIKAELEKFRTKKSTEGDHPKAAAADTMIKQVEMVQNAPERHEALPGTKINNKH